MIYTPLTLRAMEIAYNAHHGQKDKCGAPYILHPVHLAEQMKDEYSCCAALLHDTVEDTDITFDQLGEIFPPEVINAVRLLTHDDHTAYDDYVRAIRNDPIAKAVKTADLEHNSDPTRLSLTTVSPEKKQMYAETYARAKKILSGEIE